MKDPLTYTYDGLERELNLVEIHLKEAPKGDEAFCTDCINKHFQTIRGFALEGPGFTQDKNEQEKFLEVEKEIREIKGKDYKKHGIEFAQKVRNIRKGLFDECPECEEELGSPEKIKAIENLTKDLNNKSTFSNYQLNKKPKKMERYSELAMMNAGQFAAEGVRYLLEWKPQTSTTEKVITMGGGLGLQALGLFVLKRQPLLQALSLIAGSNLLAGGVVKWIRGAPVGVRLGAVQAVATNAGVGGYAGKAAAYAPVAGGPVFGGRVTATNIPTRYARAGILSGAQAFESPEHADLIRVD